MIVWNAISNVLLLNILSLLNIILFRSSMNVQLWS
jgi:hypothetical protein